MTSIAYCKIYPSVGIARLGDSKDEDGYFIGPECTEELPHKKDGFTFRDSSGRIKRQAARFRIYAFDNNGNVIGELTSQEATITWKAQLANKKAAWFAFNGTDNALKAFSGERDPKDDIRNGNIGELIRNPDDPVGAKYKSDKHRTDMLEIVADEIKICGPSLKTEPNSQEHQFQFIGDFKGKRPVYLGELRTDDCGRLMVFGGHGESDAIDENGNTIRASRWIRNYANNDDWFDDTSDGYVRAEVVLNDSKEPVEVRGAAWVIVAPPDFAPDTKNLVTLYDVMEEVAHDNTDKLLSKELPVPRSADSVDYDEDIKPIFERMYGYRWVNDIALRGHGFKKPGDFKSQELGNPSSEGKKLREHIFNLIRVPTYQRPGIYDDPSEQQKELAKRQANASYMPPFSGDEGDNTAGEPSTWMTVTYLQHSRLEAWSKGNFVGTKSIKHEMNSNACKDVGNTSIAAKQDNDRKELQDLPFKLTRTALEQCVGGPFFPGIEITAIARHPGLYREAYRFNDEVLKPGDITKYMALPWQADFYECQGDWWPAQRPDNVLVDEDFEELFSSFEEETVGDHTLFESVLFNRKRWDRGLGQSRPSGKFLQSRLLPEPKKKENKKECVDQVEQYGESVDDYINARTTLIAKSLFNQTEAANYFTETEGELEELKEGIQYIERLPSPWRLQFLVQETLDRYSGRYFHLVIPSPEAVFGEPDEQHKYEEQEPDKSKNEKPKLPISADELRSSWTSFRISNRDAAIRVINDYAIAIYNSLLKRVRAVFEEHPALKECVNNPKDCVKKYYDDTKADFGKVGDIESEHPEDFQNDSETYRRLRLAEMLSIMMDILYVRHSSQAGDMDMVDQWSSLGFVVEKERRVEGRDGQENKITVVVETERDRYDGLSFRDYFYFLMNIEKYPDFVPYAKVLAKVFLKQAEDFIEKLELQDPLHPESFVEYSETNYEARLEEIYEILRARANNAKPWLLDINRADAIRRIVDLAPFNQTDGSWLRNIARTGPSDEMYGLLFDIWSDEIGNGVPSLHHGNLYTALLQQLGHWLPEVNSKAYADHPDIPESSFIGAVLPLVISQHSNEFLPEILGMTLFLEWEVLSLVPGVKRLDYLGIDSHFFRMHIAIDNATEGHGYAAKRAVQLYLDQILKDSGPEAMQQHWRHIWTGFVAFALGGSEIFSNDIGQSDSDIARSRPGTPAARIAEIMRRKRSYGNLNHANKKLGGCRINDLFDDPEKFLEELEHSPWIEPGNPEQSKLLSYLTSFDGPMYKIFDKADLEAWREWIVWLVKEGNTSVQKHYIGKGEAMLMLLIELRAQAEAAHAHIRHKLRPDGGLENGNDKPLPVSEWFSKPDLKELMRALKNPDNGWVVPGSPEESSLVMDLAAGGRPMSKVLDRRFPSIGNQIGRLIIVRWILAGCPIPGEELPKTSECGSTRVPEIPKLLVQEYGMGAVH